MICRRCGNRIPEYLVGRESFRCPECGRQFGTPTEDCGRSYEQYEPRQSRYEQQPRRAVSRFEDPDDRYYDDRAEEGYYDDGQGYYDDGQGYYDDDQGYYDDGQGYYDDGQGYYDDEQGYYDDGQGYYDDGYYDDQPVYDGDDLSDLINGGEPRPAGMKLTTVLYVLVAAIVVLIVVFCVDAGLSGGEAATEPTAAPSVEATAEATDSPYPTV